MFASLLIAGIALALMALAAPARAAFIVAPNSLTNTEGNISNGFPFGINLVGITSQRYQQVYAASQFSSLGSLGWTDHPHHLPTRCHVRRRLYIYALQHPH